MKKKHVGCGLTLFVSMLVAPMLFSQSVEAPAVLERLFTQGVDSVSYSKQFSQAVSSDRLEQIVESIESQLGGFKDVTGVSNPYIAVFENGEATTYIYLDEQNQIAGLQFTKLSPYSVSMEQSLEKISAYSEEVSYLVRKNGKVLAFRDADKPYAVGSAFKLAVLAAVKEAVEAGGIDWDDTYLLQEGDKSLPSGVLQDWPQGAPLTIHTLASLMISISDNTATDALISIVGRQAVQQFSRYTEPFLTTREMFVLKNPDNEELKKAFLDQGETVSNELWEMIAEAPLPSAGLFTGAPMSLEIEWFFSTGELCELMERVADLDVTTINPGVAVRSDWERISYKGGSEPGVLNLTTRLEDADGNVYCVSVTWNDTKHPLPEEEIFLSYNSLLNALE